jgi:putative ABC transport system permease protein
MRRTLKIIGNSLRLAILELRNNKLRTILSLMGVSFGIFCIIGVLSMVTSLERNIQNDIKSLGTNSIYLDKWDYNGGANYPWWKYVNRPEPKFHEMELLKQKTSAASHVAMNLSNSGNLEYEDGVLAGINYYGVTEEFGDVQHYDVQYGRDLSPNDFSNASPVVVIGYENAEKLFGNPEKALGKEVMLKGRTAIVTGVIKKQGKSMVGAWEFDRSILMPYRFFRLMFLEKNSNPVIMIKGKDGVEVEALKDDLKGAMRSIRKLGPMQEDDFALNAISDFSKSVSEFFGSVNLGGWFIGLLSLIVGAFSIANIMFVTVRERTPIIGLKKAIGAKRLTILAEFLLESAFICILGGLIGVVLVFLLTLLASSLFDFPVFISPSLLGLSIGICILIGVLAGIIPASIASRLDAVVAIRSK